MGEGEGVCICKPREIHWYHTGAHNRHYLWEPRTIISYNDRNILIYILIVKFLVKWLVIVLLYSSS